MDTFFLKLLFHLKNLGLIKLILNDQIKYKNKHLKDFYRQGSRTTRDVTS